MRCEVAKGESYGVEIPVLRIVHQKTRKGWKTVRSMQKAWWIPFDAMWFVKFVEEVNRVS